ncbi:MAG: aminopeptidase P N-terminal domain-containing protein [Pseudomonadales bacterium]|nr:aminopeptidase P N-terminal domain-containing protein [Pseudomonadales bacterium]
MRLMESNSIAILPSARQQCRNGDVEYRFRQDSDFYYLSGFTEPESVLVLIPGRPHGECILFCREKDPLLEQWHGKITGPEKVLELYGFDDAFPITDIDEILPGLIEAKSRLYYALGSHLEFDQRIMGWVNSLKTNQQSGTRPPGEFVHLDQFLHELRLFKSKQEVKVLQRAADITVSAHKALMQQIRPGIYEYQLEATLLHRFMSSGAMSAAYPSIVGAGDNACILHYIHNDTECNEAELVLVDAGCEYQYYASDVTRTYPVSGRYTTAQKEIYSIVLEAQEAAISMIKPGNHWNQPHEAAVEVITQGLIKLGLLTGSLEQVIAAESYKKFTMHRTGHWLGLDVHDVGEYKIQGEWRVFEPGMVTTVEPGIYIHPSLPQIPAKYLGIGIRIEDDILVTQNGYEVLTADLPKDIQQIEALMTAASVKRHC